MKEGNHYSIFYRENLKSFGAEENKKYISLYKEKGISEKKKEKYRNILIEGNYGLIFKVCSKFHHNYMEMGDFISICVLKFPKILDAYNPKKRVNGNYIKFSTYLVVSLKSTLIGECANNKGFMSIKSQNLKFNAEKKIQDYYSEPLTRKSEDGKESEYIEDETVEEFWKNVQTTQLKKRIECLVSSLEDPFERNVIVHLFGLYGKREQKRKDIAKNLKICRERVRQLMNSAFKKLRPELADFV